MDFTAVAARFVDECLRSDGSLFLPGRPVWTQAHVEDLYRRFVENPDLTPSLSFPEKLRGQTAGADPDVVVLSAELFYLLLVPQTSGGTTKQANVNAVLEGSSVISAVPSDLAEALDGGIASYGAALAHRFPQYVFLLEFVRAWKRLSGEERDSLVADPWRFREFVFSLPRKGASSQVEALLHMTFADVFEPIVSVDVKQQIVAAFREHVHDPSTPIDAQILEIRQGLTPQHGEGFSFYDDDVRAQWSLPVAPVPPRRPPGGDDGGSPLIAAISDEVAKQVFLPTAWLQRAIDLLNEKRQVMFYGPPGTGKTFVAQAIGDHVRAAGGSVDLIQFHPAYSYEDFFEGYRPVRGDAGGLEFTLQKGPLRRIADRATHDGDLPHLLIIDEINRGNIAKIFGELYFLLEYRERPIDLQYSSDKFKLPGNLFLIGTMNTADRSIALIDSALRRRFYFYPFLPHEPPIEDVLTAWLSSSGYPPEAADLLKELNSALQETLPSEEFAIGPSYFMPRSGPPDIDQVWQFSIMPLLEERFFGVRTPAELAQAFGHEALRKRRAADDVANDDNSRDALPDE